MSPEDITVCFITTPGTICGIFSSLFIMFTILEDSLIKHRMNSTDKIMFSLSFSNLCLCVFQFTSACFEIVSPAPLIVTLALSSYGVVSSAWLTCCLCFFYLTKIVQFSSRFLSWLKMKIDELVPWMIMVVELVTLPFSFLRELMWYQYWNSSNTTYNLSLTEHQLIGLDNSVDAINYVFLGLVILITAWTSAFLTLHIHRMERSTGSSSSANEKTKSVLYTMVYLLVYYILYYLVLTLAYIKNIHSRFLYFTLLPALTSLFSTVQSILLILSNTRYKERLSSMFPCRKGVWKASSDTDKL